MEKSWLDWLHRRGDQVERRADVAPAVEPIAETDFDRRTGTLKWDRFMSMLEAERQQGPGALLLVDLKEQSRHLVSTHERDESDILPLLSKALRQAIRSDDLVAHSDHYRFAILLRSASQEIAGQVSTRVMESVEDTIFITASGVLPLQVSVEQAALEDLPPEVLR
nr:hypothetical protein [uncultured Devosia sp.]